MQYQMPCGLPKDFILDSMKKLSCNSTVFYTVLGKTSKMDVSSGKKKTIDFPASYCNKNSYKT